MVELDDIQLQTIEKMKNGCILCADVGTGKSRTALAYYILKECGGGLMINGRGTETPMRHPRNLYIITTAKKRDDQEWERECAPFGFSEHTELNHSGVTLTVDSWNNIAKYRKVCGGFFIFDEQRVKGSGKWVKAFQDIARKNKWILLSATPGDSWKDYIPVFVANGFYRNKTDFMRQHAIWNRFCKYPKVDDWMFTGKLYRLRDDILIRMEIDRDRVCHHIDVTCEYDKALYSQIMKTRWDPWKDQPIQDGAGLCYCLRRAVNEDESRMAKVRKILAEKKKAIIFYNFDYELEELRRLAGDGFIVREWNGHRHEAIPGSIGNGSETVGIELDLLRQEHRWVYLVQYAGAEGWNCITCDTIIFYSQSYSYSQTVQAAGRIDRRNSPFKDLYFYHLRSLALIDVAIKRALKQKKKFNENSFVKKLR